MPNTTEKGVAKTSMFFVPIYANWDPALALSTWGRATASSAPPVFLQQLLRPQETRSVLGLTISIRDPRSLSNAIAGAAAGRLPQKRPRRRQLPAGAVAGGCCSAPLCSAPWSPFCSAGGGSPHPALPAAEGSLSSPTSASGPAFCPCAASLHRSRLTPPAARKKVCGQKQKL